MNGTLTLTQSSINKNYKTGAFVAASETSMKSSLINVLTGANALDIYRNGGKLHASIETEKSDSIEKIQKYSQEYEI